MPLPAFPVPGTTEKQAILDHGKSATPQFFFVDRDRPEEMFNAFAEIMSFANAAFDDFIRQTRILEADGAFLDQHGLDRGLFRRDNELDETFRQRIRNPEDAITRPAILDVVDKILVAAGISQPATMFELPCDGWYWGTLTDPPELDNTRAYWNQYRLGLAGEEGSIPGCPVASPLFFIVIVPIGTTQATRDSIEDAIRFKKAAGVRFTTEQEVA